MVAHLMNSAGRPALQLGRGVDTTTGSPLGVAIEPGEAKIDPNDSGQTVSYDVTIIESSEEFQESMGLSVGAEMRYGLFDASGKFEMSEKTGYKSFATYVLARCEVMNPPIGLFDPVAKHSAIEIKDIDTKFQRAFGDSFVRSALTGGEFYVLIEIVHEDTNVQKSVAASLQAEYNSFFASANVDFTLSTEASKKMSTGKSRIVQYQAAGTGVECSLVDNVDGALNRLKAFPIIARDHPISLQVELAPYDTIPDLQANPYKRGDLTAWLDDCAHLRAKYKQVVDELEFFLTDNNRSFFKDPPSDEDAQKWKTQYMALVNKVMAHAEGLADGSVATGFVEPPDLPTVRLNRFPAGPGAAPATVPPVFIRSTYLFDLAAKSGLLKKMMVAH